MSKFKPGSTCRYSVYANPGGCLESRCYGLREARSIAKDHKKKTGAIMTITQWDTKHEDREGKIGHIVETF